MDIPYQGNLAWIKTRTILLTRHGSHAYGLARPTSDEDLKGVVIPPKPYFTGFLSRFEQVETRAPYDMVIYDVRKFFRLAADCNPNIIEVLWTDPEDHLVVSKLGERLLAHRGAFLSQKAKHTFSGYAMAQLKRIERHRGWLQAPPEAPPERAAFGLPPEPQVARDQLLAAEDMIRRKLEAWDVDVEPFDRATRVQLQQAWAEILAEQQLTADAQWRAAARTVGLEENFLTLLERERAFRAEEKVWAQYQQWKAGRNEARAALEAEHGHDTKHAMHLVRLMRMCREILETGQVRVRRPDRDELMAIRDGARSLDALVAWAQAEDRALDAVKQASPLPRAPDRAALDALCQELVEASFEP